MPATSAAVKEQSIREHAYHLWEQDGRPEGRDLEYWVRALQARAKSGKMAAAGRKRA